MQSYSQKTSVRELIPNVTPFFCYNSIMGPGNTPFTCPRNLNFGYVIGVCILNILTERQTKRGHGMIPFVTLKMRSGVTKVSYKSFEFRDKSFEFRD